MGFCNPSKSQFQRYTNKVKRISSIVVIFKCMFISDIFLHVKCSRYFTLKIKSKGSHVFQFKHRSTKHSKHSHTVLTLFPGVLQYKQQLGPHGLIQRNSLNVIHIFLDVWLFLHIFLLLLDFICLKVLLALMVILKREDVGGALATS